MNFTGDIALNSPPARALTMGMHRNRLAVAAVVALGFMCHGAAHAASADEPIPSFYEEAGKSPNRDYANQHPREHIDPFTGKLQWNYVDLFIPGNGGFDVRVQRSYASQSEQFPAYSASGVG